MDKNGNVKISVTGYTLSSYHHHLRAAPCGLSPPRAKFLETARIRCLIISSNNGDTGNACGKRAEKKRRGDGARGKKGGTPCARRLGSSFLTRACESRGEHPPRDTFELRLAAARMYHVCGGASPRSSYLADVEERAEEESASGARFERFRCRRFQRKPPDTTRWLLCKTKLYAPGVIGKIGWMDRYFTFV